MRLPVAEGLFLVAVVLTTFEQPKLHGGRFVWRSSSACSPFFRPAWARGSDATSKKKDVGVYLGHLLQQQRADVLCVWGVLLTEQQAAAAAARRVAVAYADVLP